jgi:hypothetical protein
MLSRALAVLLLLFLSATSLFGRLGDFSGSWLNADKSGRIISLRIRIDGPHVMVGAFARCGSENCEWPPVEALAYTTSESISPVDSAQYLTAVFKQPDRETTVVLSIPKESRDLHADVFTHFTTDATRFNFVESFTFFRPTASIKPPTPDELPPFPWPPPQASATDVVPRTLFQAAGAQPPLLGDVNNRLVAALESSGYVGKSYFAVPDGFALVTQLEQINADGTSRPVPDRWAANVGTLHSFSLSEYLKALFTANVGHYRIIVFVLTPHPFSQADAKVSREEALDWIRKGGNQLPSSIAALPFTPDFACTALIYEFEELHAGDTATLVNPSNLTGRDHLTKSNVLSAIGRPNP